MASWNLVSEETTTSPRYVMKQATNSKGRLITHTTKELAGGTIEMTHLIWRCMNCRAMAVTEAPAQMTGECGKCHS